MAYTKENFKSRKALKAAVEKADVPCFQPGGMFPLKDDDDAALEGPHYPEPHRWYATAPIVNGVIPKGSTVK